MGILSPGIATGLQQSGDQLPQRFGVCGIAVAGVCTGAQGQVERAARVVHMINQADAEGFGSCSNEGECEAVCPKEISISNIARMTREYVKASVTR